MPITVTAAADCAQIRIDGELNIYSAAESREQLLQALDAHPALALDIGAVEEIDTAGMQLLLLLMHEAKRIDKALTLSAPSPAILEVATLLNLADAGFMNQGGAEATV
jgi:anti-anti-sigma factor